MTTDNENEKAQSPEFSTADYIRQIRSAIRLNVPQDQWLKILEDKGTSSALIDAPRLIWDVTNDPASR